MQTNNKISQANFQMINIFQVSHIELQVLVTHKEYYLSIL